MKFRWVPWYKTVIGSSFSRDELQRKVRKALELDKEWDSMGNNRYTGDAYNSRFEIFFKKWLSFYREFGNNKSVILFGIIESKEKGCVIKVSIILNWLYYLLAIPLFFAPMVIVYTERDIRFIIVSVVFYLITILYYNICARFLYKFMVKAIDINPKPL